jgi:hypothetical protein
VCPACITSMALVVADATSTGGLTAIVLKKIRAKTGAKNISQQAKSEKKYHDQ